MVLDLNRFMSIGFTETLRVSLTMMSHSFGTRGICRSPTRMLVAVLVV